MIIIIVTFLSCLGSSRERLGNDPNVHKVEVEVEVSMMQTRMRVRTGSRDTKKVTWSICRDGVFVGMRDKLCQI